MIFIDSSVWISYFNGAESDEVHHLDQALGHIPLATGDLNLVEVLQGFKIQKEYQTAKELLSTVTIFELLGYEMAIKAADNYRKLRSQGITIRKTADVIIATFCIENNLPLLHNDKDFQPFIQYLGLQVPS